MGRLGETIKRAREDKGIPLKTAAKKTGLSEKYLADVEAGVKVPSEDIARRVLKFLGAYEDTTTAFYDGSLDREPVVPPPVIRKTVAAPSGQKVTREEAVPSDAWMDALSGVLKKISIFNDRGQSVASRLLAVENGRIDGFQPEKLSYFQLPDDSMRALRMLKGDLVLVAQQGSIVENMPMLVETYGRRKVRIPVILPDGRLRLVAQETARVHTDHDPDDVQIIGRCVRLEITL